MGLGKNGYYTLDDIEKTGCNWMWIYGTRAPGKSAAVKYKSMCNAWEQKKPTLALIRRKVTEINTHDVESYFLDRGINFVKLATNGECDHVTYYRKYLWFAKTDENGKDVKVSKLGECFALSTARNFKSTGHPFIEDVILEEIMDDEGDYVEDEPVVLQHLISTIARSDTVRVYMIGNTVTKVCPYFTEWGMTNIRKQKVGTIDIYHMQQEDGSIVDLACEFCPPTPHKSKMFFGRAEKSVQGNSWEIKHYPLFREKQEDFENVYSITYLSVSEMAFNLSLLIEKKTGAPFVFVRPAKHYTDRVITGAFSKNPLHTPTLDRNNPAEVLIHNCFCDNKVMYSDNMCGTDFTHSIRAELKNPF